MALAAGGFTLVAIVHIFNIEKYKPVLKTDNKGQQFWDQGDPVVGKFMQLNVKPYDGVDQSMDPYDYEPAHGTKPVGKTMIPLWLDRNDPADMATLVIVGTHETRVIERPGRSPLVYTPRAVPRAVAEAIA